MAFISALSEIRSANGVHTSRTMMLEELGALLSYIDRPMAGPSDYLQAIQNENCLGKRSLTQGSSKVTRGAAELCEPQAQFIQVPRRTLKTDEEIDAWIIEVTQQVVNVAKWNENFPSWPVSHASTEGT